MEFVARSKGGLELFNFGEPDTVVSAPITNDPVKHCRFSTNGKVMAYSLATEIVVCSFNTSKPEELARIPISCVDFVLSPSGRFMAVFEKAQNDASTQHFNLTVWRVDGTQGAVKLGAFSHKTQATWTPQWTSDESCFVRMTVGGTEIHFHRMEQLERVAFRIKSENIGSFAVSPGSYPKCALFIKESKVWNDCQLYQGFICNNILGSTGSSKSLSVADNQCSGGSEAVL